MEGHSVVEEKPLANFCGQREGRAGASRSRQGAASPGQHRRPPGCVAGGAGGLAQQRQRPDVQAEPVCGQRPWHREARLRAYERNPIISCQSQGLWMTPGPKFADFQKQSRTELKGGDLATSGGLGTSAQPAGAEKGRRGREAMQACGRPHTK